MKNKIFARVAFKFDPNQDIVKDIICFPTGTQILSVRGNKNSHKVWIHFIYPADIQSTQEFHFIICKNANFNTNTSTYKHIGNIVIHDCTYAVFYRRGAIKS